MVTDYEEIPRRRKAKRNRRPCTDPKVLRRHLPLLDSTVAGPLRRFHSDMVRYVEKKFGQPIAVLRDSVPGGSHD